MKNAKEIQSRIYEYSTNKLIFSRNLYFDEFQHVPEASFFKVLSRMASKNDLNRLSHGMYYRPEIKNGNARPITEGEILRQFLGKNNEKGLIVGYKLYNNLGLTEQDDPKLHVYTNSIRGLKKKVRYIYLKKLPITLNPERKASIEVMEVLKGYLNGIMGLNQDKLIKYLKKFASSYDNKEMNYVLRHFRYKKVTIAFLEMILNHYNIHNTLYLHLARTSKYEFPAEEDFF